MNLQQLMAAMQATAAVPPKPVEVKGWGTIYVRELTVGEVEEQTQDTEGGKDKQRLARAAARVICDKEGNRVFDPNNDEHITLISKQPWRILRQVIESSEGDPKKT